MIIQPLLRHCEHSEAIQFLGLPRNSGSLRRYASRDNGFCSAYLGFASLYFAPFADKKT